MLLLTVDSCDGGTRVLLGTVLRVRDWHDSRYVQAVACAILTAPHLPGAYTTRARVWRYHPLRRCTAGGGCSGHLLAAGSPGDHRGCMLHVASGPSRSNCACPQSCRACHTTCNAGRTCRFWCRTHRSASRGCCFGRRATARPVVFRCREDSISEARSAAIPVVDRRSAGGRNSDVCHYRGVAVR